MSCENKSKRPNVGGQAVVEGVMMRAPGGISVAVRKQSGEIVVDKRKFVPLSKRYKVLNVPVIRGFVTLIETMIIGMKALNFSADVAIEEEEAKEREKKGKTELTEKEKKKNERNKNLALGGTMVLAFALAIFLFTIVPYFLSELLQRQFHIQEDSISFNVIAGVFRILIFLIYLWAITLMKDVKRIFEYHGAEHKSIYSYENGDDLSIENTLRYSTHHPRCGTSFLFIVMISAIIIYMITDTIWAAQLGYRPPILLRILVHIPLLPIISGISYELIKISGKVDPNHWLAKILLAPGLGLQNITTQEPSEDQLEVALVALKEALSLSEETKLC